MKINGGIIFGVVATLLGVSGIVNGIDKEVKKSKEQSSQTTEENSNNSSNVNEQ